MTSSPSVSLAMLCDQAYAEAYADHGELNLDIILYHDCLQGIIDQQLPPDHSSAALVLFDGLHKNDLYLTCACAVPSEAAWSRFLHLYRRFVTELACQTCSSVDLGQEVADFVLTDLWFPNQQGRPRIASYGGR